MALSPRERVLYARHLLLHEIGSAGQQRLCATYVHLPAGSDAGARAVTRQYLERAGIAVAEAAPGMTARDDAQLQVLEVDVIGDAAAMAALAGAPELVHAARALRGAFAATEVIKRAAGLSAPAVFPSSLCLSSEDA